MTEIFRASYANWQTIECLADTPSNAYARAFRELRDRVAALEAERVAPEASTTAPTPPAAVPSDEELWGVQLKACKQVEPGMAWLEWNPDRECSFVVVGITANRALYNHGFQQGLAAGRAEQGGTPEPEPDDFQTLHGIALDMVESLGRSFNLLPEILNTLRRAIREPMAEQQAAPKPEPTHPQYFSSHHAIAGEIWGMLPDAPEPNQAPAGDGGLVDTIADIIGNEPIIGRPCPAASAVLFAVAKWLEKYKPSGHETEPTSADFFAYVLRQEAQR